MYPYKNAFKNWCLNANNPNRIAKTTFEDYADPTITKFWNFYQSTSSTLANLDQVNEQDIRSYLDYLDTKKHYTSRTINTRLAHLHKYFGFLYDYDYKDIDPTHGIIGRKWGRHRKIIINWDKCIPKMVKKYQDLNSKTIYLLLAIALGYKPEQLPYIKFDDFINHLKDSSYPSLFVQGIKKAKTKNQTLLFESTRTHEGMEIISINNAVRKDAAKLHLQLTPNLLRTSLILQCISQRTFSDQELSKKLNLTYKQIDYYHSQLFKWDDLIDYSKYLNQIEANK